MTNGFFIIQTARPTKGADMPNILRTLLRKVLKRRKKRNEDVRSRWAEVARRINEGG